MKEFMVGVSEEDQHMQLLTLKHLKIPLIFSNFCQQVVLAIVSVTLFYVCMATQILVLLLPCIHN